MSIVLNIFFMNNEQKMNRTEPGRPYDLTIFPSYIRMTLADVTLFRYAI